MSLKFGRVCLVQIMRPDGQIRAHLIDKPVFTLGRSNTADVPTLSPAASREHLYVEITDEGVLMTDLGSANGTFINDEQMEPQTPYAVDAASEVRLGNGEEVLSFYSFPRPMELTDLESQKIQLRSSVSEMIKHIEETSVAEQENRLARIRQQGIHEVSQIKRLAEDEGQRVLRESKIEAQSIVDKAALQAEEMIERANRESAVLFESKLLDVEKRKKELEIKISDYQREIQAQSTNIKRESQKQAETVLNEAHNKARELNEKADERLAHLTEEAQIKSVEILKTSEKQAETILLSAHQEAHRILSESQEKARKTRETAQSKSEDILSSAKAKAEGIITSMQSEIDAKMQRAKDAQEDIIKKAKESAIHEAKAEKNKILSDARLLAIENQEKVIADYKSKIEEQRRSLEKLSQEVEKSTRKQSELTSHISKFESEREVLITDVDRLKTELSSLHKESKEVHDMIAQSKDAEKRRAQAESETQHLMKKIEQLKLDFENAKTAGDNELKAHLDANVVKKREADEELAKEMSKTKLKSMNELQKSVDLEEKRIKDLRRHQVHDIAKAVEVKVVEHMEKNKVLNIATLGSDIFKYVADALVVDISSVEIKTSHQQVVTSGKKAERIKYTKWAISAAAGILLILTYAFRDSILSFFQEAEKNNFMAQVFAERKAAAVYNPEQTDDFKSTYTDNVIYTSGYYETKTDPEVLEKWTRKLTDYSLVKKLGLAEEDMIRFIAGEVNMVRRLGAMRETIDAVYLTTELETIRKSESEDVSKLVEIVKGNDNFLQIKAIEKEFLLLERRPASSQTN